MRGPLVVSAVVALIAVTTPAGGATPAWTQVPSANPSATNNWLLGVSAPSSRSAWAVGYCSDGCGGGDFRALVLKWNGTSWSRQSTPNPGGYEFLHGVAAVSSSRVWAVGYVVPAPNGSDDAKTLILSFNGSTWVRQPSANGSKFDNSLLAVAATAKTNAWAVGSTGPGIRPYDEFTLIERLHGGTWQLAKSPSPGTADNTLFGVVTTSTSNAWAVGSMSNNLRGKAGRYQPLIEHWNGSTWTVTKAPSVSSSHDAYLTSVTARSKSDAWAVGYYGAVNHERTLILHWNGKAWLKVPSVSYVNQSNQLFGVTATSSTSAWAVGNHDGKTLVEYWNGKKWQIESSQTVASGGFFPGDELFAVSATSARNVIAVGQYLKYGVAGAENHRTLVLRRS